MGLGLAQRSDSWVLSGWSSHRMKVLPQAVAVKIQAYPGPLTAKHLQEFWGLLGYCTYLSQFTRYVP